MAIGPVWNLIEDLSMISKDHHKRLVEIAPGLELLQQLSQGMIHMRDLCQIETPRTDSIFNAEHSLARKCRELADALAATVLEDALVAFASEASDPIGVRTGPRRVGIKVVHEEEERTARILPGHHGIQDTGIDGIRRVFGPSPNDLCDLIIIEVEASIETHTSVQHAGPDDRHSLEAETPELFGHKRKTQRYRHTVSIDSMSQRITTAEDRGMRRQRRGSMSESPLRSKTGRREPIQDRSLGKGATVLTEVQSPACHIRVTTQRISPRGVQTDQKDQRSSTLEALHIVT
jgi:hypothetical protein